MAIKVIEIRWKDLYIVSKLIKKNFSVNEGSASFFHFLLSKFFLKKIAFNELKYFVAIDNKKILGVSGIYSFKHHPRDTVWLGWTMVVQSAQGNGIGSLLIQTIVNYLKENKFKCVCVETTSHKDQENAIKLYTKFGFKESGRIGKYYENIDMIILVKQI